MSDDHRDEPPDQRTVFLRPAKHEEKEKGSGDGRPEDSWFGAPDDGKPQQQERAVFSDSPQGESSFAPYARSHPSLPANTGVNTPAVMGQIALGSVLNGIYRVDRVIGQGGMGEVYEGTEVTTEKRVAIKIILPQLASDPSVQMLFRNEAQALMQLSHSGLVQYRLLAQDPTLKVLYIVTEFIDGPALSEFLGAAEIVGAIDISAAPLSRLLRRLASALAVAHGLGIVHRDISPDNILLPQGNLDKAKIIDFGIAKDLGASGKTIIGSGFAGKLSYVAPEQFGDTRDVGPWTDVYSLGLVILAVASGRAANMGVTFAEALEKRRHVPDLAPVPAALRPVLARMLEPEPRARFSSMEEVVTALDGAALAKPPKVEKAPARVGRQRTSAAPFGLRQRTLTVAALAVFAIGGLWIAAVLWLSPASPVIPPPLAAATRHVGTPSPVGDAANLERVVSALSPALKDIRCTWLDMDAQRAGRGLEVKLSGVAGDVAGVNTHVSNLVSKMGVFAAVDTSDVSAVQQSACGILDAFRQFRAREGERGLASSQTEYHILPQECLNPGTNSPVAKPVVTVSIGNPQSDFFLGTIDPDGKMGGLYVSRARFVQLRKLHPALDRLIQDGSNDSFQQFFCMEQSGLSGLFLVKGKPPLNVGLPPSAIKRGVTVPVGPDWPRKFAEKARVNGWVTDMAWYRVTE